MRILFAASENAWGGFLGMIRSELPEYQFEASGSFQVKTLEGYDVLIPTMCQVTGDLLKTGDRLKLIQQCGSGLEGVDIESAQQQGIWVANVPTDISGNADSVAELGIYMMIGLSRNIQGMARSMQNRKMGEPQGKALSGKTVGLIGLGGIGKALIRRLKAFDVRMIGIKRSNPQEAKESLGLDWAGGPEDLPHLIRQSDFLILCLPCTPESIRIINQTTISFLKPSAFLINLSRGGLVDRDALEQALSANKIAGAGLDVFWEEPPDPNDAIFRYNVLATPHIAASTDVAMKGIAKAVAENIRRVARNQKPLYAMTEPGASTALDGKDR